MTDSRIFTSIEVRWFFDGGVAAHAELRRWFEADSGTEWRSRLDGEPDVYLLLPGAEDMGIKWREGLLQVKGRAAADGIQAFGSRHAGVVERWIKWSYAGMPDGYRRLFIDDSTGIERVSVRKTRALRLLDVAPGTGGITEVPPGTLLEHGIAVELTDLRAGDVSCTSLGFEAFPDVAAMRSRFTDAVAGFLQSLGSPVLDTRRSLSYPAFLNRLASAADFPKSSGRD